MRIAQIMLSNQFGGAERSFIDISQTLEQFGHVVLAIGSIRSKSIDKLDQFDLQTERVACLGVWDVFTTRAIKKVLIDFEPDLIQCHLARASYLAGCAGKDLGIPVVAKTHNLVNPKYYKHVNKIVVTTEAQRAHLLNHGVSPDRLRLIPNFSAVQTKSPKKKKAKTSQPIRIVTLGRFVKKKGFDTLLRAFSIVIDQRDLDVELHIGGNGPENRRLLNLTKKLGISKQVKFVGWVDKVSDFLDNADLFVLPSEDEPFGIVILEAMAMGVPILTTETQGPLEILDRNTGSFTRAGDPIQMAADMERILLSEHRFSLANASKARFEEFYTARRVCARYLELFEELIGK